MALLSFLTLSNALGGIVLGQAIKRDVNLFIADERLVYVPNGIENRSFLSKNTRNNNIQVLFLSNLHPHKGPFDVLKAANIVVKHHRNVRFVLAGADSPLILRNS